MAAGPYQVILLGSNDARRAQLRSLVSARIAELGLPTDAVRFINESEWPNRDPRAPIMGVFFGAPKQTTDTPLVAELIDDSIVVAPLVTSLAQTLSPMLRI
jgi:hypothetical protein